MLAWRFDQGRLDYFQVDEIKKIACALADMDRMHKPGNGSPDTIREILKDFSDLPFKPSNYYVWRNYGRVFECMMLATVIGGRIISTELCRKIAADPDEFDSDDYLAHFSKNFYYSSPIFEDYDFTGLQVFPVVAIIKFLISQKLSLGKSYITIEEIGSYLIANEVTGLEEIGYFSRLRARRISGTEDFRQLRELVKVISQFSFLKWEDPYLYIETSSTKELYEIEKRLSPIVNVRRKDAGEEILQMGMNVRSSGLGNITLNNTDPNDEEFVEGKRIRVVHLRSERSSRLKNLYFKTYSHPEICNMCELDTSEKYPWASHVIELHHLLPLASPVRVEKGTTSVRDLVGLCPSCHRATHRYYSQWFRKNMKKDFGNYSEAISVYQEAKDKIVKI